MENHKLSRPSNLSINTDCHTPIDYDDDDYQPTTPTIDAVFDISSSAPLSPLYVPSNPKPEYMAISFSEPQESYTKVSNTRKRIYGEEFNEPTILTAHPKCKLLKLEHPEFEKIDLDIKPQSSNNQPHPHPTPTARQYNILSIDVATIPRLCMSCFSINCICYLFSSK